MSAIVAELHERIGQVLTALRANAAYLLRTTADRPELQAAARDVELQGAAIDRDLRALLRCLPPEALVGEDRVRLHEIPENWQHSAGRAGAALRLPDELSQTLCRMIQDALTPVDPRATLHVEVSVRAVLPPGTEGAP